MNRHTLAHAWSLLSLMYDQTRRKKVRWDICDWPPTNSRRAVGRFTRSTRPATFLGHSTAARRSTIFLSLPLTLSSAGFLGPRGAAREVSSTEPEMRRRRELRKGNFFPWNERYVIDFWAQPNKIKECQKETKMAEHRRNRER
jgi:hypothetical protein